MWVFLFLSVRGWQIRVSYIQSTINTNRYTPSPPAPPFETLWHFSYSIISDCCSCQWLLRLLCLYLHLYSFCCNSVWQLHWWYFVMSTYSNVAYIYLIFWYSNYIQIVINRLTNTVRWLTNTQVGCNHANGEFTQKFLPILCSLHCSQGLKKRYTFHAADVSRRQVKSVTKNVQKCHTIVKNHI